MGQANCYPNVLVLSDLNIGRSITVSAEVGIDMNENGGFALTVNLDAQLELAEEQAVELVKKAHQVCPYSNATRGNIEVAVTANGVKIAE